METNQSANESEEISKNETSAPRSLSGDLFQRPIATQEPEQLSHLKSFKPMLDKVEFIEKTALPSRSQPQTEDIKLVKTQLDNVQIHLTEFVKASQFKFDRLVKSLRAMEQIQSHQRQEIAAHYAELSGKLKERRVAENKISDLIDRHNQIVNDFEVRLSQMKKTLNDRELKFLQVKTALEDAQREIERLKKV